MKLSSSNGQHTEVICHQCLMHCQVNYFATGLPLIFVCNECSAVHELTGESMSGEPLFSFRFYAHYDND